MPRMKQMLRKVSGVFPHHYWEVVQRRSQDPSQLLKVTEAWIKIAARSVCLLYGCSGLVLPCQPWASIKQQEWIQGCSPDGPTLCWRLIWDATLCCATCWPRLVVGQATKCKSTLLAWLHFGIPQAMCKALSWDVVCECHLPVSLDTDANGSHLILFFLFLLDTNYLLLFGLIVAFLSATVLLNSTGTEPGLKYV